MSRVSGYRADDPAPGARRANRRDLGVEDARELLERFHVGSIVYFEWAGNLQNPAQVAALSNGIQRAAAEADVPPVLIATDQEGGIVRRLGAPATSFPGAMALGATRDPDLAREVARVAGGELAAVGIRQNLAPVADVNVDPANPVIGIRSFGSRPELVSTMVAAQVRGFQEDAAVAATAKHFPGHGDTDIDSHSGLPTIRHDRDTWWTPRCTAVRGRHRGRRGRHHDRARGRPGTGPQPASGHAVASDPHRRAARADGLRRRDHDRLPDHGRRSRALRRPSGAGAGAQGRRRHPGRPAAAAPGLPGRAGSGQARRALGGAHRAVGGADPAPEGAPGPAR